jgi:hypothetical protein
MKLLQEPRDATNATAIATNATAISDEATARATAITNEAAARTARRNKTLPPIASNRYFRMQAAATTARRNKMLCNYYKCYRYFR